MQRWENSGLLYYLLDLVKHTLRSGTSRFPETSTGGLKLHRKGDEIHSMFLEALVPQ